MKKKCRVACNLQYFEHLKISLEIHDKFHNNLASKEVTIENLFETETRKFRINALKEALTKSKAVVKGIMDLSVKSKKPIGNGIITCLNMKQALERADPDKKDIGGKAISATLKTLSNF
mgnify:CR=1 FL=1